MHVRIIKYKKFLWWSSTFKRQTRKISAVVYALKGNVLDLYLQFGLMKINIVNELKYLMIAFTEKYQVI